MTSFAIFARGLSSKIVMDKEKMPTVGLLLIDW